MVVSEMAITREQALKELERRRMHTSGQQNGYEQQPEMMASNNMPQEEPFYPEEQQEETPRHPFEGQTENPFVSAAAGFNRAIGGITGGIYQPIANMLSPKAAQRNRYLMGLVENTYERSRGINPKSALAGNIAGDIAATGPFFGPAGKIASKLIPKASKFSQGVLGGALGGAGVGGAQYTHPDESRILNAALGGAVGGTVGAAIPIIAGGAKLGWAGLKTAKEYLNRALGSQAQIEKDLLKNFTPEQMKEALIRQHQAKRAGLHLTPGEASGSRRGTAFEAKLGASEKGAENLERFKLGQQQAQRGTLTKLFEQITPKIEGASEKTRAAAKAAIKEEEEALQEQARPFYEAAEPVKVSSGKLDSLMRKDGTIEKAVGHVAEDKIYKKTINDFGLTSIATLNEVKKYMDGKINSLLQKGHKRKAGLWKEGKDRLVDMMDKVSPEYKTARAIYEETMPDINLLTKREVGKIANVEDINIKNIPDIVFNPKQTETKEFNRIRDTIIKQDPEAWRGLVRNELEQLTFNKGVGKSEHYGSNFYDKVLSDEATFKRFYDALKGDRKAQFRLRELRNILKDITNFDTTKAAHVKSKGTLDRPRSRMEELAIKVAQKISGGEYDQAMIDLITTDKWENLFREAIKTKDPSKLDALFKLVSQTKKFVPSEKTVSKYLTPYAVAKGTETNMKPFMETPNYDIYEGAY